MKKIKTASVAGTFYPENKEELSQVLENFEANNRQQYNYQTRAIIVPHAGYFYSGQLASEGYQYLGKNTKNIFIIAPAHHIGIDSIAVSSCDTWQTPLGETAVNQEINKIMTNNFGAQINDAAIEPEHAIEVQVPFVQKFFPDAQIIPILVGSVSPEKITEIISHFWTEESNSFVISSDLSHFYKDEDAQKIDDVTAEMIEANNTVKFSPQQACGHVGILGLLGFAQQKKFSFIRINLQNSSTTSGDTSRVVGYGSWLIFEGAKEKFIKEQFSDFLLDICWKSILSGLTTGKPLKTDSLKSPEIMNQSGATFVTLEIDNNLRGCIGSILPYRSLIEDITENAFAAAFSDPRFPSLTQDEFELLDIAVSLLTVPTQMSFYDEEDLMSQIQENIDGIIVKDGAYQAVYLPSVWEQLPDKNHFMGTLKQKAGLSANHFSKTFEVYRFRCEYIKN